MQTLSGPIGPEMLRGGTSVLTEVDEASQSNRSETNQPFWYNPNLTLVFKINSSASKVYDSLNIFKKGADELKLILKAARFNPPCCNSG